jgi:rhodanese-related sulfurtransferase
MLAQTFRSNLPSMNILKKLILSALVAILYLGASNAQTSTLNKIDVKEFNNISKDQKSVVILDVRTPQEVAEGKIKGAKSIDFMNSSFKSEIQKLDKNKTYLVYCKAGGRSDKAVEMMNAAGFKTTYSLAGGITAWKEEGKPIEK